MPQIPKNSLFAENEKPYFFLKSLWLVPFAGGHFFIKLSLVGKNVNQFVKVDIFKCYFYNVFLKLILNIQFFEPNISFFMQLLPQTTLIAWNSLKIIKSTYFMYSYREMLTLFTKKINCLYIFKSALQFPI